MKNSISINLLPQDLLDDNKRTSRVPWLSRASIALIFFSIIATVAVFIWTLSINLNIKNATAEVSNLENKVTTLKEKEGLVTILKNRLDKINALTAQDTVQSQAFLIVASLLPSDIKLLNLSVDKSNKVSISGETASVTSLEKFFISLVDSKDKISLVKLESLSKNQKGLIRFDINFVTNIGKKAV